MKQQHHNCKQVDSQSQSLLTAQLTSEVRQQGGPGDAGESGWGSSPQGSWGGATARQGAQVRQQESHSLGTSLGDQSRKAMSTPAWSHRKNQAEEGNQSAWRHSLKGPGQKRAYPGPGTTGASGEVQVRVHPLSSTEDFLSLCISCWGNNHHTTRRHKLLSQRWYRTICHENATPLLPAWELLPVPFGKLWWFSNLWGRMRLLLEARTQVSMDETIPLTSQHAPGKDGPGFSCVRDHRAPRDLRDAVGFPVATRSAFKTKGENIWWMVGGTGHCETFSGSPQCPILHWWSWQVTDPLSDLVSSSVK